MTPDSSTAQIITAVASAFTAIALIITAVGALRRSNRVECKVDEVQKTGQENHKMLNSEKKERMDYQRALIRALEDRGITVPVDQSQPDPEQIDR